jgi:hypothetical protein
MSNLIPGQHKLTVEEQSEGGKKSAKVRSQRRKAREIAEEILSMPIKKGKLTDLDDINGFDQIENTDVLTSVIAGITRKAIDGSVRHAEMLLMLTGDYSKKMEVKPVIDDDQLAVLREEFDKYSEEYQQEQKYDRPLYCDINKYTYAMYFDKMQLRDFTTEELKTMLQRIYDEGIDQAETWDRPLDKGALIDHLRKTISERERNNPPKAKTVEELLEQKRQSMKEGV